MLVSVAPQAPKVIILVYIIYTYYIYDYILMVFHGCHGVLRGTYAVHHWQCSWCRADDGLTASLPLKEIVENVSQVGFE